MTDPEKDPQHAWMSQCTQIPGVLGCGIHRADGSILFQSMDEGLPGDQLENLLRRMAAWEPLLIDALKGFKSAIWRFEKASIRCDWRTDGTMACVVVRQEGEATSRLDERMSAFMTLA